MTEPIAIVGSACRFPGEAQSPSKLWDLLHRPRDVLVEFPPDRLKLSNFYNVNGEHHGSTNVTNKSYLLAEDAYLFDANFFNVNPLEAQSMDPQQRILLETVYEALERAGYTLEQVQGSRTSVFVGVMNADFYDIQLRDSETIPRYNATGTARSILSNRISYFFDLKGPSMTIDTACSSSLVALHQAVLSLRNGESTAAIVAGANLILDPMMYIAESNLHMLSPEARSRMWDKSADGYARGEGFAAILLKPLNVALKDGDDIECIIRGSGVNSDGRTTGITMPSALAQADLIRQTYASAGLDPSHDRPQFVECHGTGTAAGDPQEARALQEAFFPSGSNSDEIIHVGSVKTLIGHLEGCAGLAGILKTSLALQNKTIPQNMHFNELNPSVAPFYNNLLVATEPIPWPESTKGPMRASVNSFGFGGTNSHVILEAFQNVHNSTEERVQRRKNSSAQESFVGPLVFSAASQPSLLETVKQHLEYIKLNPSVDLKDLSWVLQKRRSIFPIRAFFSGSTRDSLIDYMENAIQTSDDIGVRVHYGNSDEKPRILGIFTGQGAQWATMGRALIRSSPLFRQSIEQCENSLATLPDPPSWSLIQEVTAEEDCSRIYEAAFSQPLCTALQIAMVDLCHAAGLTFDAVVGHSSGEIAAVYAAGIISAKDAVRIAYYRGFYAKLAQGPGGIPGSMMAIGMGFDEATDFCKQPEFRDRIHVAASNSPSSVTLSGDKDVITNAKTVLDDRKVFARLLQVDTAYHSSHMLHCAQPYLESLSNCNIDINLPQEDCIWVSSVRGDIDLLGEGDLSSLKGQYWVDNMVQPVLFSQALECALWSAGPFEMVLEVGPHPALKGPAMQTFKSALGKSLPYVGLMRRATDEVEAFSGGIGYVWSHIAGLSIDFNSYRQAFLKPGAPQPTLLKDLPSYSWDHEIPFWRESRISRQFRLRETCPHELLGRRVPDDSDYELRWRNILKLREIEWIRGHEFQGQALFPAMGYVSMVFEALKVLTQELPVQLIEVEDFVVHQAVVLEDGHPGVETVFTMKVAEKVMTPDRQSILAAEFACYACLDESSKPLVKTSSGRVRVYIGEPDINSLPPRQKIRSNLSPLNREQFYESLENLGLKYQGLFRPTSSFQRCLSYATGCASWTNTDLEKGYAVHPAVMDVALHSIFVAFASPISNKLWTTYLPVAIRRLSFNPNVSLQLDNCDTKLEMDAFITESSSNLIQGDVHVYDSDRNTSILIEGVRLHAFTEVKAANDRILFTKTVWDCDIAHGFSSIEPENTSDSKFELCEVMERTSLFFFQKAFAQLSDRQIDQLHGHFRNVYESFQSCVSQIRSGKHSSIKTKWLKDSEETIINLRNQFTDSVDLEMLHAIGQNLTGVLQEEVQLIEVMMENDLLNRFYMEGRLFVPLNRYIGNAAKAISHKHPNMNILEIGAGTGGTTKSILQSIGNSYSSYTYTDISSGFFNLAQEKFSEQSKKMKFQLLDIEKDVTEQGYTPNSYDMVVAANVLHATSSLEKTMIHVRSLLKPGGYLLLVEVTGDTLQLMYVMGGFPGWWLGVGDGRVHNPGISPGEWQEMLQNAGFTGVEAIIHDLPDLKLHSCSAIISQAVDDKIDLLRNPLTSVGSIDIHDPILILGGRTLDVARLSQDIQKQLSPHKARIHIAKDIEHLESRHLAARTSVIYLSDLDTPLFSQSLTDDKLGALQQLVSVASNILWLTRGRLSADPHSNMVIGLGRTLQYELPDINIQFLDIDKGVRLTGITVAEKFLQLILGNLTDLENNVLWKTEPELSFNGSVYLIPRVVPYQTLNDRYNAARRTILKEADPHTEPLEIVSSGGSLSLKENYRLGSRSLPDSVSIQVKYSTSLCNSEGMILHIALGSVPGTDKVAVALSPFLSSIMDIPVSDIFVLPTRVCSAEMLLAITSHLLCLAFSVSALPKGPVIFYEPGEILSTAIKNNSLWSNREVHFATSKQSEIKETWIYFHKKASRNSINSALPQEMSTLFDLSSQSQKNHWTDLPQVKFASTVESCLLSLLRTNAWHDLLSQAYEESTAPALRSNRVNLENIIQLRDVPGSSPSILPYPRVVYWESSDSVTATVSPLDCNQMFSPDRTYFMCGMNSELGMSICRWMAEHGARYIVITSRSGKLDRLWLDEMVSIGAVVKAYEMDVTDRDSVQSVYNTICQTMPPIAGVCNAAMILSDKLFTHMTAEAMSKVLSPKVDGTIYLDEIFSKPSLDFFIAFSSLASVVGNAGQANYHAANMFMTSLMAQRRARGLAASVIHIGLVVDVGYVARAGQSLIEHLMNLYYAPLSETDIHHLFAEAVIAGSVDSKLSPDIIMGVEPVKDMSDSARRPPWWNNPIFSFLRLDSTLLEDKPLTGSSELHIREQLNNLDSEEAVEALTHCFASRLEAILHLNPNSVNVHVPLLDLGTDSLLAVEIRQWFLAEIHVDIPVLKVLSGDSATEICVEAFRKYQLVNPALPPQEVKIAEEHTKGDAVSNVNVDTSVAPPSPANGETDSSTESMYKSTSDSGSQAVFESRTPLTVEENQDTVNIDGLKRIGKMSYAQSRIWFQERLMKQRTAHNIAVQFDVEGTLEIQRFEKALRAVIERHESLRSCYFNHPDLNEPMQGVMKSYRGCFSHIQAGNEETSELIFRKMESNVWNLENGDTFQITLVSSQPGFSLIFGYHHILMDGVSWHLFLRDLSLAYQQDVLPPVKAQALEFSMAEALAGSSGNFDNHIDFWRREHTPRTNALALLPFARVKSRPLMGNSESYTATRKLSRELLTGIRQASQANRATSFHFHLAILQILLFRLTGCADVCIGVTDANRGNDSFVHTIGFFLNLLPLRFQISGYDQISEIIRSTARKVLSALEHSTVPFDLVLEKLNVPRSPTHSPLFQVALNYRVGDMTSIPLGDCHLKLKSSVEAKSPYDIVFNVTGDSSGTGHLQITTLDSLYTHDASEQLCDTYVFLLNLLTRDPSIRVQDCPLSSDSLIQQSFSLGSGPRTDYRWPTTLSEVFNKTVGGNVHRIAVKDSHEAVTYLDLDSKVKRIAGAILASGQPISSKIAVMLPPSIDLVASLLAVLRTDNIYVPIDLSLPEARRVAILNSCSPNIIICNATSIQSVPQEQFANLCINISLSSLPESANEQSLPTLNGDGDSPSFLLYTSGSTGVPKGIVLSQRGFLNYLAVKGERLAMKQEVVLQQSSVGFDMSIAQIFNALAHGGTLIIVPQSSRGDPLAISQLMVAEKVSFMLGTPSEYLLLLRYGLDSLRQYSSWRHACLGGEAVTEKLKKEFLQLGGNCPVVTDCYGPTEISAATSFETVDLLGADDTSVNQYGSVGKAIPNTSIYIVGEDGNPVAPGFAGEICVGGVGVALGYWQNPLLNAAKFVINPFASSVDKANGWKMMYKTGDRGRLSLDGSLIFMGRMDGDTEIKLRGLRIDLDEVANGLLLAASGTLSDAVVSVRGDPQFLVAHVVPATGQTVTDTDLQSLKKALPLPQYMCPAIIVLMKELPMTANGKVDRKYIQSLPLPTIDDSSSGKRLTLDEGELRLVWREVLQQSGSPEEVTSSSDFFIVGGNSLLLVKLQGAIKDAYGLSVPLKHLYQSPTLASMAALISAEKTRKPSEKSIDWDIETAIPQSLSNGSMRRRSAKKGSWEVILTGSTGFLGSAILKSLIEQPTVSKVHCIAVDTHARQSIQLSPKVVIYNGSLNNTTLGLSDAEFEKLQSSVDVIIHAGAHGHCLNNYSSLRTANFASTCFLANFALSGNLPVHFISSSRVTLLSGNASLPPVSVANHPPNADGSEGFTAAKWASERYLEKFSEATRLPVHIHRHCSITGDQAPSEDALNAILRFSSLMRAVPRFSNVSGYYDFKDVNDVAADIVQVVVHPVVDTEQSSSIIYQHHSSGAKVQVDTIRDHMEQLFGYKFDMFPLREWIEKARGLGIEPLIVSYLEALDSRGETVVFPYLGEQSP